MTEPSRPGGGWLAMLLGLTALTLLVLPRPLVIPVEQRIRDIFKPGILISRKVFDVARAARDQWPSGNSVIGGSNELRGKLVRQKRYVRQLELSHAELTRQLRLARQQSPEFLTEDSSPLVIPEMIPARVIAAEQGHEFVSRLLLDTGSEAGAVDSAWILESQHPLIDQGLEESVDIGQPVYAGAVVVGRVVNAGLWMSAVQRVTDPAYRGKAVLVRAIGDKILFGADCRIVGTGKAVCQLEEIPATESVAVGDRVYSGARHETLESPLYYGTVIRAELADGAEEWSIDVEPAVSWEDVNHVTVLRESVNRQRMLGN